MGELNNLIKQLGKRSALEAQLAAVYANFKEAIVNLGLEHVSASALPISKIKIEVKPISVMGVVVPRLKVKEIPRIDFIQEMELHSVAEHLEGLMDEMLFIAQVETEMERIANELLRINRKVNALEKIIIPSAERQVRYIQESLLDEDLEDFSRIKHLRNLIGRQKIARPTC